MVLAGSLRTDGRRPRRRCDRLPLTDLTIAAAAQSAAVGVVHFDRHFERLGESLGIEAWWIAEPPA